MPISHSFPETVEMESDSIINNLKDRIKEADTTFKQACGKNKKFYNRATALNQA